MTPQQSLNSELIQHDASPCSSFEFACSVTVIPRAAHGHCLVRTSGRERPEADGFKHGGAKSEMHREDTFLQCVVEIIKL